MMRKSCGKAVMKLFYISAASVVCISDQFAR